jgi:hypothetical protein
MPHHAPTIILKSRAPSGTQPLIIGSKQRVFQSPPVPSELPRPRPRTWSTGPPQRAPVPRPLVQEEYQLRGGGLLVRFGIDSVLGRMVARTLVWMMLTQPLYVSFAMELTPEQGGVSVESGIENTESDSEASVAAETGELAEVRAESDTVNSEDVELASATSTAAEVITSISDATSTEERYEAEPVPGDATSTQSTTTDSEIKIHTSDSNDSESSATSSSASASSTEEEAPTEAPVIVSQNPTNKYVFGEGDCTVVADGEFYCVAAGATRQATGDPRVYAEKDREGDREIFYFDGVDVQRITNNGYDDFAPVFDEVTKRIVWQSTISDRIQIMVHELETNTTRQITTGRHNSSNPDIAGDVVVWQEWVDTNWEVMQTNVDNAGAPFEITQLTDNAVHDMFPQLYNGLITWQREKGESWEVVLYDQKTATTRALEKDENTKYENPRFVLMFDSTHDNGDVETIGYDLESGDMMELGTKANRDPFVPATPKDEVPDVPVQAAASSTVLKVQKDEDVDSSTPSM